MAAIVALLAAGLVLGGMAFFSFVTAPLVFRELPREMATAFMRAAFPRYYGVMGATAAFAAAFAALEDPLAALLLALAAIAFVALRQMLIPALEDRRVRAESGSAADEHVFKRLHGLSVVVNVAQLVVVASAIVRLAT